MLREGFRNFEEVGQNCGRRASKDGAGMEYHGKMVNNAKGMRQTPQLFDQDSHIHSCVYSIH